MPPKAAHKPHSYENSATRRVKPILIVPNPSVYWSRQQLNPFGFPPPFQSVVNPLDRSQLSGKSAPCHPPLWRRSSGEVRSPGIVGGLKDSTMATSAAQFPGAFVDRRCHVTNGNFTRHNLRECRRPPKSGIGPFREIVSDQHIQWPLAVHARLECASIPHHQRRDGRSLHGF